MQQELNRLDKIGEQIKQDIQHENDMEEYVILESKNIAESLYKSKSKPVDVDVQGTQYRFMYFTIPTKTGYNIVLNVANLFKLQTLGQMYRPYSVVGEVDNGMSELANLTSVVEGFLRYDLDVIKPEILPDDED